MKALANIQKPIMPNMLGFFIKVIFILIHVLSFFEIVSGKGGRGGGGGRSGGRSRGRGWKSGGYSGSR